MIYLLFYVPQLLHNRVLEHIKNFSVLMHILLCIAYLADLMYGFALHLPWQYRSVSIVGVTLVLLQHLQLIHYFWFMKQLWYVNCFILGLISALLLLFYYFVMDPAILRVTTVKLYCGGVSQICFLLYTMPQLIKNYVLRSTAALSLIFIYLNLLLALLDTISAWCLHWGWPNKFGSPFMVILMVFALLQSKKYSKYTVSLAG